MAAMFDNKGVPHLANWSYSAKTSKLPPRCPFQSSAHSLMDTGSCLPKGKKQIPIPKETRRQHQRTSSESFIIEEQPSWLDDLLNEPETPVRGIHRRSSSDSVAFLDTMGPLSKAETCSLVEQKLVRSPLRGWESPVISCSYQNCVPSSAEECIVEKQEPQKSCENNFNDFPGRRETMFGKSAASEMDLHAQKGQPERKEYSDSKLAGSETDPKRVKQHFAQRSRVRKLQYIAELEQNVSMLHAEGSDVAAELAFLKQQHLILSLENKALMQRISSIAHEKQIKDAQYELLTKEVERLKYVYCNQQKERSTSQSQGARGTSTVDAADSLYHHFGCLSLNSSNHKKADGFTDPVSMKNTAPYPCMMLQNS